jgi:hypothetical protein
MIKKYLIFIITGFLVTSVTMAQELRREETGVQINVGVTAENSESKGTGGTQDINIGVGELQEDQGEDSIQHNETNTEFISERASDVSVKAVQVRGWDPDKKEEFIGTVKLHAEVRSDQDLENFATGVLLHDENVTYVVSNKDGVEMGYIMPSKLFGFIPTGIPVRAKVGISENEDNKGRVKVKFPWYRVFFNMSISAGDLETAIGQEINDEVIVGFEHGNFSANSRASLMLRLSSTLKAAHDVAMNSIRNLK